MRTTELRPTAAEALVADLTITRDEPRQISIVGLEADPLVLTIGATIGGDPLIEITGTGTLAALPELIQVLTEGGDYFYNIWKTPAGAARELVARGKLTIGPSIAPTGVDVATVFLGSFGEVEGITRLVAVTLAEYQALAAPDPSTLYIVR